MSLLETHNPAFEDQDCFTDLIMDNDFLRFMHAFDPEFVQDPTTLDEAARDAASFAISLAEETAVTQRYSN